VTRGIPAWKRIVTESLVLPRIGKFKNLPPVDGVAEERDSPVRLEFLKAELALEPLPSGIDE
jgi:hypothetical protein